jgi:glycosyltransferase involved in cell wall biosynthesis
MKVALDISPLKSAHKFRGIGSYTKNLVASLKKSSVADFQVKLVKTGRPPQSADLIHYPYFDFFWLTLPLLKPKKTVVTIHDVIPLLFSHYFPPGIKGRLTFYLQKFSLRGVKRVICDSKNSRRDIVKHLGVPKEKIEVVYLAPGQEFEPINQSQAKRLTKKYHLPSQFILYVGDVNYHKNLIGLLRAYQKMSEEGKKIALVLVGKAFENKRLKETKVLLQLIKELKLTSQVKILGFVPIEELVAVYNLATVYCQPSLYEGFGLPVLEAMACGIPVVASKEASLAEICGQAAVMIDPYNLDDLAGGLTVAIENKGLREKLIERGLKRAQKFTWEKTAQETIKVYQQVDEEKK